MTKTIQSPLNIELPVGSRLGWDLDNTLENDQLHSVAERSVIALIFPPVIHSSPKRRPCSLPKAVARTMVALYFSKILK
jgi:hypothetical protein